MFNFCPQYCIAVLFFRLFGMKNISVQFGSVVLVKELKPGIFPNMFNW